LAAPDEPKKKKTKRNSLVGVPTAHGDENGRRRRRNPLFLIGLRVRTGALFHPRVVWAFFGHFVVSTSYGQLIFGRTQLDPLFSTKAQNESQISPGGPVAGPQAGLPARMLSFPTGASINPTTTTHDAEQRG
jgi:hypothetical protein